VSGLGITRREETSLRISHGVAAVVIVLAACSSHAERCVDRATLAYRNALAEQREIEASIARGYSIDVERVPYQVIDVCYTPGIGNYPCTDTRYRSVERRVPVDTASLRRRSAEISRQLPALRQSADRATAQCNAQYGGR